MLPNWSEHKANCLAVKADCVCLQCDHLPGYLYSDARHQYHFVWRDTNEEPHPSECLDCLSEVIEASRFPPTEQFVI